MFEYLLKSGACMAIFMLFYKLLLERENMHVFKRFYLLGALVASLIIPTLVFVTYVEPVPVLETFNPMVGPVTPEIATAKAPSDLDMIDLSLLLLTFYSIGAFVFGMRFLIHLFEITHRIRKNPKIKEHSITKVLLGKNMPPHTFFRYIFLNKRKYEANSIPKEVLLHEETHAKQKHSYDVLFVELLQVVLWFNPLIYLFKKSIKLNHEFLADSAVLKNNIPAKTYQNTLLSFLSPENTEKHQSVRMANAIDYSSVKKRFTVMKKRASKKVTFFRIILLLPLTMILLYGFSETKTVVRHKSKTTTTNDTKPPIDIKYPGSENRERTIGLAGLVIDSETLLPIEKTNIYDAEGNLLAATDERGFFQLQMSYLNQGDIKFRLKIEKDGYLPLVQDEHWGNFQNGVESVIYFGLQKKKSEAPQFSELVTNPADLTYESTLSYLKSFKANIEFRKKLSIAKSGTQDTVFEIDGKFYLVNDFGWIEIASENDLISLNGNKIVPAGKLNDLIKREEIVGMTPLENNKAKYAIYTSKQKLNEAQQQSATPIQIAEYNALAKKYYELPLGTSISTKDLERINHIYGIMTAMQKAEAEPYPFLKLEKKQQESATPSEMDEYRAFMEAYEKNKVINYQKYARAVAIYNLMNENQKKSVKKYPKLPKSNLSKTNATPPTSDDFEAFKNKNTHAVWLDGKAIDNEALDHYKPSDFVHFFKSYVYNNARSQKFPQEYQVHLYTANGLDKTFNKKGATDIEVEQYNILAKKYNAIPIKTRTIPMKDLRMLESIYSKMTKTQKENAQPFPECLPKNEQ